MIDISSPNKLALNKAKRRMSPERDGWDTEKRTYTAKTPDTKKRKLDVAKETKDSNKKPKAKAQAVEYKTFEMRWNETNNPDHWLDQLKDQGAYNQRCRCTLITKEDRKHLVVRFPTMEKKGTQYFPKDEGSRVRPDDHHQH